MRRASVISGTYSNMYSARQTAAGQAAVNIFVEKYNSTRPGFYESAPTITSGQFLAKAKYNPIVYLGMIGSAIELRFNYDNALVRDAFESLAFWSAYSIPGGAPTPEEVFLKMQYTPVPIDLPSLPKIPMWPFYLAGGVLLLAGGYILLSRTKQLAGTA